MAERGEIDLRSVVLSQDLSQQISNRRLVVSGIYTGAHVVHGQFPVFFQVGVTAFFISKKQGTIPIEMRLEGDVMSQPQTVRGTITVDYAPEHPETQLICFGVTGFEVLKPGSLRVMCGLHGKPPELQCVYRFKKGQDIPSADSASATTHW